MGSEKINFRNLRKKGKRRRKFLYKKILEESLNKPRILKEFEKSLRDLIHLSNLKKRNYEFKDREYYEANISYLYFDAILNNLFTGGNTEKEDRKEILNTLIDITKLDEKNVDYEIIDYIQRKTKIVLGILFTGRNTKEKKKIAEYLFKVLIEKANKTEKAKEIEEWFKWHKMFYPLTESKFLYEYEGDQIKESNMIFMLANSTILEIQYNREKIIDMINTNEKNVYLVGEVIHLISESFFNKKARDSIKYKATRDKIEIYLQILKKLRKTIEKDRELLNEKNKKIEIENIIEYIKDKISKLEEIKTKS